MIKKIIFPFYFAVNYVIMSLNVSFWGKDLWITTTKDMFSAWI